MTSTQKCMKNFGLFCIAVKNNGRFTFLKEIRYNGVRQDTLAKMIYQEDGIVLTTEFKSLIGSLSPCIHWR